MSERRFASARAQVRQGRGRGEEEGCSEGEERPERQRVWARDWRVTVRRGLGEGGRGRGGDVRIAEWGIMGEDDGLRRRVV